MMFLKGAETYFSLMSELCKELKDVRDQGEPQDFEGPLTCTDQRTSITLSEQYFRGPLIAHLYRIEGLALIKWHSKHQLRCVFDLSLHEPLEDLTCTDKDLSHNRSAEWKSGYCLEDVETIRGI